METIFFWTFAAIAVTASLLVVAQRNPMHSVLLLIVSFGALAGLYVLLDSPFAAVTQIIIYAGAILVLFLFVVMLLNASTEVRPTGYHARLLGGAGPRRLGAALSVALFAELWWAANRMGEAPAMPAAETVSQTSSVKMIGIRLYDLQGYAFAFEATSVLILVAMVGAIILARREKG